METQYTWENKMGETLMKLPGSVKGQPFDISSCKGCRLLLLDHSDQVQIDDVSDSRVFIAASSESVFIRNCSSCTFTIACKQFRTRDCTNCIFYLYSKTEPAIETSNNIRFAPFNGAYDGHKQAMEAASLNPERNLWFAVYDFNDDKQTGNNWRYLNASEEDPLWTPLNDGAKTCCPRVKPGAIKTQTEQVVQTSENSISKFRKNKTSGIERNHCSTPSTYTTLSEIMNENSNSNDGIAVPATAMQTSTIVGFGSLSAGYSNLEDLFSPIYERLSQTAQMIASSVSHAVEQCHQLIRQLFD